MKHSSTRRLPFRRSFSPRLEMLEDRWCPAVTTRVIEGHILQVLGDRGANAIEINQHGSRVSVTGDGARTQTFTGIDTIRVNTWAGDDLVRFFFEPNDSLPRAEYSFTADLGAGSDSFTLVALPTSATPPPDPDIIPCIDVAVQGGAGLDTFHTMVGQLDLPPTAPKPHLGYGLELAYEGGAGDDSFDSRIANIMLDGHVDIVQKGNDGQDRLATTFGNTDIQAPLTVSNEGGLGNDDIRVIFDFNPQPDPPAKIALALDGGAGDDAFSLMVEHGMPAAMSASILGGAGKDDIRVIYDFNPQPDPPARLAVTIDGGAGDDNLSLMVEHGMPAAMSVSVLGGAGKDAIDVLYNFDPQPNSPAQVTTNLDGGAGDDVMTLHCLGAQLRSFNSTILGGEGNDSLTLHNWFTYVTSELPAVQFTINMKMDGGAGNDSLNYLKTGFTVGNTFIQMLGGNGNDHLATANSSVAPAGFSAIDTTDKEVMDGGDGSDLLTYFVIPPDDGSILVLGNSFDLTMNGGAGNDTIIANASFFGPANNSVFAKITENGGTGDDQLVLFFFGAPSTLLMDGGPGFDGGLSPASHSPTVTVINCEY